MWVKHHEKPQFIINNYDAKFTNNFLETFFLDNENEIVIEHNISSTNGLPKRKGQWGVELIL
jgi:hypothetical protein